VLARFRDLVVLRATVRRAPVLLPDLLRVLVDLPRVLPVFLRVLPVLVRVLLDFLRVMLDLRVFAAVPLRVLVPVDLRALLALARFFAGTLAPALRASERPIAIACLRLFTVLPERPLFNVPRLRSRITFSTLLCAFFPYLAIGRSSI